MPPKKTSRRKLFTTLGVGITGALVIPKQWSKPVVDSVVLPAHAQTSVAVSNPIVPPTAVLNGVVDGNAGTTFTADASASTGSTLSFVFSTTGPCTVSSQSGDSAVIQRGVIAGMCNVTVVVTNSVGSDMVTESANVIAGPPPPP